LATVAAGWYLADARGVTCCAATRSRSAGALNGGWRSRKNVDMITLLRWTNETNIAELQCLLSAIRTNRDDLGEVLTVLRRHTCQDLSGIFC
jgi:hypothetical protein